MKVLVRWQGNRWWATGDSRFHGFGRSLETALRAVEASIETAIQYEGVDPAVRAEGLDVELALDPALATSITRREESLADLRRAERTVEQRTAESLGALLDAGIGSRDAAQLVGLSRSVVQRVVSNLDRDPAPNDSASLGDSTSAPASSLP